MRAAAFICVKNWVHKINHAPAVVFKNGAEHGHDARETKVRQKKGGDDDGNFQRTARGQAAFGNIDGQQEQKKLSCQQHGEPEPVLPRCVNFQAVTEDDVIICAPAAKGQSHDRQGEQQQRGGVKEDGEDGPAFHEGNLVRI